MWHLTWATLRTQWRRFTPVLLAVALGTGFLVATQVVTDSLAEVSRTANRTTTQNVDVLVRADDAGVVSVRDHRPVPQALVDRLRATDGVAAVDGEVVGYAELVGADGDLVDPGAAGQRLVRSWSEAPGQSPYRILEGAPPVRDGEVVLDANLAARGGFGVGDTVAVVSAAPTTGLTVAGIAGFGDRPAAPDIAAVFTTRATAQRLTGAGDGVHRVYLTAAAGTTQEQLAERVRPLAEGTGARAVTGAQWRDEQDRAAEDDITQYRALLTLFAVLALVLGAFVIANAFTLLAAQRTRESALLRAVGATGRQVARRLRAEAAAVGLAGSVLGIPLGLVLALVLQRVLQALDLTARTDGITVAPLTLLGAVAGGVLTAVLGGSRPAARSARTAPVEALRRAAVDSSATSPARTRAAAIGAVLAGAGLGLGPVTSSAPVTGVGVVTAFVAAVLAAPLLALRAGKVLERVGAAVSGAPGQLAGSAAQRTPRRTAAAATAVAAAVMVITLVAIVASTIHATFSGTVAEQYRGQSAVLPAGYSSGQAPGLPADVPARVAAAALEADPTSRVLTVSTSARPGVEEPIDRVGGVGDPRLLTELFDLGRVTGDPTGLGDGDVAVHSRLAGANGWAVGDTVGVPLSGGTVDKRVTAVFSGLGDEAPLGGYLLTRDALLAADPAAATTGLYLTGAGDPAAVRGRVATALADTPNAEVVDREGYVRANEGDFRRIFAAVYALLALAGAVSLVGVANTLLLSVTERAGEIARLRAVGLTPRQLRTVLRWEALGATLLGVAVGLGLGVLAGTTLVPTLAGDLRLTVPYAALVAIAAGGVLAGGLLAVPAQRRAARISPVTATG